MNTVYAVSTKFEFFITNDWLALPVGFLGQVAKINKMMLFLSIFILK